SMTYQEISKKLNLSYLTVYKYLNVEKYPEVKLGPEMGAAVEDTAASKKKPGFWSRLKSKLKT
ncbi:MAG: hypothetical protein ACUVQM_06080, partial [Candidatus Hadarchaeaceae archaeon]